MIKLITMTGIRNEVGKFTSMVRYRFKGLAYQKENELLENTSTMEHKELIKVEPN